MLAVATAAEAVALRRRCRRADPRHGLGRGRGDGRALDAGAEISIWRDASRELLGAVAADLGVVPRVHVKFDSGMGRLGLRDAGEVAPLIDAVAADERMELAASGPTSRPRTTTRPSCTNSSSGSARSRSRRRSATPRSRFTLRTAPRRSASPRPTSTWCAAVSRSTASIRSGATRATTDSQPALELALLRRGRQAIRAGRQRGLRADLEGPEDDVGRAGADRLRRRLAPRALESRRGARRRPEAARSSARSRWTTSPSTWAARRTCPRSTRSS